MGSQMTVHHQSWLSLPELPSTHVALLHRRRVQSGLDPNRAPVEPERNSGDGLAELPVFVKHDNVLVWDIPCERRNHIPNRVCPVPTCERLSLSWPGSKLLRCWPKEHHP